MMAGSVALQAHYAGENLTIATLWKITRADAHSFYFTDHDVDIPYLGNTYVAATGYLPSAVQTSSKLNVDNLEVTSVLDADFITDADLIAGLWDYADVYIYEVNWADLTMGARTVRRGKLGEVSAGKVAFTAELRGMMQNLQQEIGRLILPACDADLGDTRCGVTLATYTSTGTITAVTDNAHFTDSGLAGATGLFDYGKITFTGGLNDGLGMEVKTFTSGGAIVLQQAMPYAVAISDTFSIYQGCDKSTGAGGCTKFSNIANYRGFPDLPGVDRMVSGK